MTQDRRQICPVCAWRANCVKRFSRGDDTTLHCPDFSEDLTLRRKPAVEQPEEDSQNKS